MFCATVVVTTIQNSTQSPSKTKSPQLRDGAQTRQFLGFRRCQFARASWLGSCTHLALALASAVISAKC